MTGGGCVRDYGLGRGREDVLVGLESRGGTRRDAIKSRAGVIADVIDILRKKSPENTKSTLSFLSQDIPQEIAPKSAEYSASPEDFP